jgi:hypothetical protein
LDQLCTSLDQLLVNVLLGRVFTILRQFDSVFLLRRTVGCLIFLKAMVYCSDNSRCNPDV